jgi:GNAT superfamily N-acetyltransferase
LYNVIVQGAKTNRGFCMTSKTDFLGKVTITQMQVKHGAQINQIIRAAFHIPADEDCSQCIDAQAVAAMCERFAAGQFVAVLQVGDQERVVGLAATMRTHKPPTQPPLPWWEMIGTYNLDNHQPAGEWLYGVEMAVHPDYQGYGVGTALYNARFELVQRLNLKGWYAGGVIMGYRHYKDQLTPHEYAEKVLTGEIKDPTVTMQINRGFEAWAVIDNYLDEPIAGNTAILIVWKNPMYRENTV